ncbi:MAG: DUF815 domain-containing protein [Clostridia bacterium]|nr:DUF815 domain-containing protein [Clostridia bacterium]
MNRLYHDTTLSALLDKDACAVHDIIKWASEYGMSGNIVRSYVAYALIKGENAFSLSCEYTRKPSEEMIQYAQRELTPIYELFRAPAQETLGSEYGAIAENWKKVSRRSRSAFATRIISQLTRKLSRCESARQFTLALSDFYNTHGTGEFALDYAFRLDDGGTPKAISLDGVFTFDKLIGLDAQKSALISNTRAMLAGKRANNVLLYGDGGSGKTTCVKALTGEFGEKGLRIIEIYRHELRHINALIDSIKNRGYKFILFMDDLSFENNETDYKYLKALIDGGLEPIPQNVAVYATSNRRHIVKESWKDKEDNDDELHRGDTIEEKLALAKRFGLSLYFPSPDQRQYLIIVRALAERAGIKVDAQLEADALRWELREGGKSGRTAEQFIASRLHL